MQIGAELFGDAGHRRRPRSAAACCCRRSRRRACAALHLDLGHVGVYRALAAGAGIAGNGEDTELFAALRAKDAPGVAELTARLPAAWRDALTALPTLYGPAQEVLAAARARLPDTPGDPQRAGGAGGPRAIGASRRSRRCTSISPTSLGITTRTARSSRCSRRASRARSATAAATTASARRSGARARPPASRSTCGSSRAWSRADRVSARRALNRPRVDPTPIPHSRETQHGQERRRHRHPVGR